MRRLLLWPAMVTFGTHCSCVSEICCARAEASAVEESESIEGSAARHGTDMRVGSDHWTRYVSVVETSMALVDVSRLNESGVRCTSRWSGTVLDVAAETFAWRASSAE